MLNFRAKCTTYSLEEYTRYSKHLILPQIKLEGQERLKQSSILCVGAGGLGSPALIYLAASGIGKIGIVDNDIIDISNLQRQILYTVNDIGLSKAYIAKKKILEINPTCNVQIFNTRLQSINAIEIIRQYDIIIDGTDNFGSRYIISDSCLELNKIHIYGAIFQFEGQVSTFNYQGGPKYRDFHNNIETENNPEDTCSNAGVLGLLPGIIGTLQATEAIKIILGYKSVLSGIILKYNAMTISFEKFKIIHTQFILSQPKKKIKSLLVGNSSYPVQEIDVIELQNELYRNSFKYIILDVRSKEEYEESHLDKAVNLPIKDMKKRYYSDLNLQDKISFIYCSVDSRSIFAYNFLRKQEFKVIRVKGGLSSWTNIIGNEKLYVKSC
uniref:Probable molybdopterin-synthase adenylyltransferase n=1 Tax=Porphyra purpurea TaxID=2787 RepID=MOEB_PORPU|nr:molybdopterin biosynthesis protein [Porphyra purpurea]P51335.1 RecName: Full=Probable molybdopterin-synthase adenylyltransferase; AltName: Full=MoaD protein adenylase; AltName: Full=Molybdopterin-converting factor subunit 1 adenylase; AltName: Full=Sulfur carrier protein MoaD adenylyltransferase [Porphyra purpurea]AAC08221.1 ORF382 [Porphyra purpurea]